MDSKGPNLPTYLELVSALFPDTLSSKTPLDQLARYPEALLQHNHSANKYYNDLQANTLLFINVPDLPPSILPWKSSHLYSNQRRIISQWSDATATQPTTREAKTPSVSSASHLFCWSSSDSYIEERKQQLTVIHGKSLSMLVKDGESKHVVLEDKITNSPLDVTLRVLNKPPRTSQSLSHNLTRIVDEESNKFIEERVQALRAKQTEQAAKELYDRKLKEHKLYLDKVRVKEAQEEREIFAATAEPKNTGFFGSFFRFGSNHSAPSDDKFTSSSDDVAALEARIPEIPLQIKITPAALDLTANSIRSIARRASQDTEGVSNEPISEDVDTTSEDDAFKEFIHALPDETLQNLDSNMYCPVSSTASSEDKFLYSKSQIAIKKSGTHDIVFQDSPLRELNSSDTSRNEKVYNISSSKCSLPSEENLLDL